MLITFGKGEAFHGLLSVLLFLLVSSIDWFVASQARWRSNGWWTNGQRALRQNKFSGLQISGGDDVTAHSLVT